jgi:hypothetical protein
MRCPEDSTDGRRLDAARVSNRKRYKLCGTIALPVHFRDPRSKELMKTHVVLVAVLLMAGTCASNCDGEDRKRHRGTDRSLPRKISHVESLRRTRRNRRHLRVGMYHAAGNHSAEPHLHHAARKPGISQRLGHGRRSNGQLRGQPHPLVDLSRKRAPVDQIARRAALSNYYAERTRTRGDVTCLPVNLPIIQNCERSILSCGD